MASYQFAGQFLDALLTTPIALLPSQAVTVKNLDANNATLYTSRLKASTASNPVTTDASGNLSFFADPGQYNLSVTIGSTTTTTLVTVAPDAAEDLANPFNVKRYGAKGDGTTNDTAAIQSAANAAAGGILYFPEPASFYKTTGAAVTISSNTFVIGVGWGSLVKRVGGGTVFDAQLTDKVTFVNMGIDCNAASNFATCIDADQATDFRVMDCRLINSGITATADTFHAVLCRSGTNVWILRNRCEGVQIKVGANSVFGPAKRYLIADNVSTDAYNFAISAVCDNNNAACEEFTIARNEMINSESGGIFAGQDGTTGIVGASFKRLSIIDNRILGDSHTTTAYIQADLCDISEQWLIARNQIEGVTAVGSVAGIRVAENDSVSSIDGLTITENQIDTLGHHAIQIENAARIRQFLVALNYCRSQGDIYIANSGTTTTYGEVIGNTVQQILLTGNLDVNVAGNNVRNAAPSFQTGMLVCIANAGQTLGLLVTGNNFNDSSEDGISFSGAGTFSGAVLVNRFQQIVKLGIRGLPSSITCRNNIGFVTENAGTSAIASGATTVTVTHGLGYTPAAADISLTPTNNPTNDPGTMWVTSPGSTTFVVNCRADPGASTATFAWAARKV